MRASPFVSRRSRLPGMSYMFTEFHEFAVRNEYFWRCRSGAWRARRRICSPMWQCNRKARTPSPRSWTGSGGSWPLRTPSATPPCSRFGRGGSLRSLPAPLCWCPCVTCKAPWFCACLHCLCSCMMLQSHSRWPAHRRTALAPHTCACCCLRAAAPAVPLQLARVEAQQRAMTRVSGPVAVLAPRLRRPTGHLTGEVSPPSWLGEVLLLLLTE